MDELRKIIGENLAELRKQNHLTQLEIAEHFNYSDKTVSKWEKGDILPDIETLYRLCEFYGVTLDFLTHEGSFAEKSEYIKIDYKRKRQNNIISSFLIGSIVWMIIIIIYVWLLMTKNIYLWQLFVWGAPLTGGVIVLCNRLYFHKRMLYFWGYSFFVWTLITAFYVQFMFVNPWPLFLVGIPAQVVLVLWANFQSIKKGKKNH